MMLRMLVQEEAEVVFLQLLRRDRVSKTSSPLRTTIGHVIGVLGFVV
jgi:hypothetical protein